MTTKKRGPEDMRRSRAMKREQLVVELDNLLDDVDILVTKPKDGKQIITFDMGRQTAEALELVAAAQGKNLDEILRGVLTKNLKEAARLKMVKDHHDRQVKIAELKAEVVKLRAGIGKYDDGK